MSLKITKSTDAIQVERLNLCIYGSPGSGKTSLAFTAATPLLFDFDAGAHRSANRGDTVQISAWTDVAAMSAADFAGYKTVVVDTAGRALDVLTADIIKRNPKAGRGGALTLQGYGALKAEFVAWLKALNSFGLDVILVAHSDEQRDGDEIRERLDVQGGSKGEIYKAADAMARLSVKAEGRLLNFNPTETAFGKNPGQFGLLSVPHPDKDTRFLAGVIQQIKDKFNTLSQSQTQAQALLEQWRMEIAAMQTAEAFTAAWARAKTAPKAAQALFSQAARDQGLTYDKAAARYVQNEEVETAWAE